MKTESLCSCHLETGTSGVHLLQIWCTLMIEAATQEIVDQRFVFPLQKRQLAVVRDHPAAEAN